MCFGFFFSKPDPKFLEGGEDRNVQNIWIIVIGPCLSGSAPKAGTFRNVVLLCYIVVAFKQTLYLLNK